MYQFQSTPTPIDVQSSKTASPLSRAVPIWWANGVFFVAIHLGAFYGAFYASPVSVTSWKSLILAFVLWQLACFGITLGYHRLYSHRTYHAVLGVRIVLAILGSMAFQGSIKWWLARLGFLLVSSFFSQGITGVSDTDYIIFTDDRVHDPYAATRGLFFSHMGWIFFKPSYERMAIIDKSDLERDPVVRYQHKHYVPIALFSGLIAPALMGWIWGDTRGAFIWAGLVARVATWHCTFLVNSLAHWDGLQKYSDEVTARGNFIMALLTCGEGNHNFHAFPHDFRSGPAVLDWDPSKWIIQGLFWLRLASRLQRARDQDIEFAMHYMERKQKKSSQQDKDAHSFDTDILDDKAWQGPVWERAEVQQYVTNRREGCFLIVNDCLLDATSFLGEHPGGSALLRTYSLRADEPFVWKEADWAFKNLNYHSQTARRRLHELAVAKILPD